jgi:hypothetical protein
VRQLYLSWRENEGGLVFFRNASLAQGAALVTPDGQVFLSTEFMVDSACQMPAMSKKFGDAMGQRAVEVSPVLLRMANGELCRVAHQYKGMTVVLAKGTDQEASCELDFWCVPGLERLADAILPTVADHQFAGAGVDRVLQVYRYRPGFASEGSLEVAELPVVCHRRPQSHTVLAPFVPATAPVGQPVGAVSLNVEWAEEWQRRHQGLGDPAAEVPNPPEHLGEASGLQQHRKPQVLPVPVAHRPRVTALRQLLLLLLSLLLVVSCLGCVGAVPVHQPRGGTFRCQPG